MAWLVTTASSGGAIRARLRIEDDVVSSFRGLPYRVAFLYQMGGSPFASCFLEQGTVVRGSWWWQALLKPYPVGTDVFEPR